MNQVGIRPSRSGLWDMVKVPVGLFGLVTVTVAFCAMTGVRWMAQCNGKCVQQM